MGKLNVMQHPVYGAVHVCRGCGKIKLVTKWVKYDPAYLDEDTYVVATHCPDCFRNIIAIMEEKKRKRSNLRLERKIRNKIKKKLI
ncbi:MAG: hypothetical protein JXQ27_17415 [Acidobacteria bacterium]|nr:hypothetical protein [Acidobacteriota bacterium]